MPYGTANVDTIQSSTAGTPVQFNDGNGTQVGTLCRAWVNFNGTTSPGTIRASFNVSSVTRNGTGDYTANFTNALSDANYAAQGTLNDDAAIIRLNVYSTTSVRLTCIGTGFTALNASIISVSVFR
jgi:hypothetical protein